MEGVILYCLCGYACVRVCVRGCKDEGEGFEGYSMSQDILLCFWKKQALSQTGYVYGMGKEIPFGGRLVKLHKCVQHLFKNAASFWCIPAP